MNILFKNNKLLKAALKSDRVWAYITDRLRKKTKKETDADPFKVLWISPKSIQSVAGGTAKDRTRSRSHAGHFKQFRSPGVSGFGSVADGDWDRSRETFDQLPIYVGLRERYEQGIPWEDTTYYGHWSRDVRACRRRPALTRCRNYEKLLESIKRRGYKTQRQQFKTAPHKEIVVNIGRDGELLFNGGGRHRLSIAKFLNLELVPVIVKVRHKEWQRIRDEIRASNGSTSLSENARRKLDHPDLQDILTAESRESKGRAQDLEPGVTAL